MFPDSLNPYRAVIESTALPTVLLSKREERTAAFQSKIGGRPYFPIDYPVETFYLPYPQTANVSPWPKQPKTGRELLLLLQINFDEMPPLDDFPTRGILQIFVDDHNWYRLGEELRVIFHDDVIYDEARLVNDFGSVNTDFRVNEHALSFHKENEYITCSDHRFEETYRRSGHSPPFMTRLRAASIAPRSPMWRDYLKLTCHRHSGHPDSGFGRTKIGGYHYSQNDSDPRALRTDWEDAVLLVQFQDYNCLNWGDGGSAQFFIRKQDLLNKHFDNLMFHWDST